VTPGSSAGFGVREAVLIVILQISLDREAGVLVALVLRLVTLAGDLLFFVASLALPLPGLRPRQDSTEIKRTVSG
jgi:glycosyltransferase 2 family protein